MNDPDVSDSSMHARIIAKAKQLLGYEGLTHPDGQHERGARPVSDIVSLLDNIEYCYLRAKIVVLEELLFERGVAVEARSEEAMRPPTAKSVNSDPLLALAQDSRRLSEIRTLSERLTAFWSAVSATEDPARRAELIERYGGEIPGDAEAFSRLLDVRR